MVPAATVLDAKDPENFICPRAVAAAAVNPGDDLTYFTTDDLGASQGHIEKVILGKNSLNHLPTDEPYGLIANGTIASFKIGTKRFEAPFQNGPFRLILLSL